MIDKKTFGAFMKAKRTEKNYSQRELAELLFVTEGAVSKWERGISYPDITLISDICRILDITEHEFITASTDTAERRLKYEAKKFRAISSVWFWVPTISYAVALITCFICNLAINHTLTWFYIVLAALICAYSFMPTFTSFFKERKLLVFVVTSYLSICLLLFTCAVYTNGLYWCLTACIGVLIGYILLFVPILLTKTSLSRFNFLIAFSATFGLTILLLFSVNAFNPFMLSPAVLITFYAFIPVLFCSLICMLRFDGFLKAGICTPFSSIIYYFSGHIVNLLFGTTENHYNVDFNNWKACINGNIHAIVLSSLLLLSAIFIAIGVSRSCKKHKK